MKRQRVGNEYVVKGAKKYPKYGVIMNTGYDKNSPHILDHMKWGLVPRGKWTRARYGYGKNKATAEQKARRIEDNYRGMGLYTGHGAYLGDKASQWLKANELGLLSGVGQRVGDAIQDKAEAVGRSVWGGIKKFFGRGAYDATIHNALIGGSDFSVPSFAKAGGMEEGAICISHKEYVTDVYGPTTAFNCQTYQINPGLEQSFPWLSQIAQNFDEYEFKQLIYSYRSTTTDIGSSTNGQCGTVIMCTNYNAAADPFADKQSMMEYEGCGSSKTTEHQLHGVECDPSKLSGSPGKYTRANGVVVGQDIKTYDHAQFNFAVANSPAGFANNAIGEMWVSYTVVLRKPKFFVARGLGISQDIFVAQNPGTYPLGVPANLLSAVENNIGCIVTNPSASTSLITIPAGYSGQLEVKIFIEGTGMAWFGGGAPTLSIGYTGNVVSTADLYAFDFNTSTDLPVSNTNAYNDTRAIIIYRFKVSQSTGGVNNTVSFNWQPLTAGTYNLGSLYISEYNGGFGNKTNPAPILQNSSGQIVVP